MYVLFNTLFHCVLLCSSTEASYIFVLIPPTVRDASKKFGDKRSALALDPLIHPSLQYVDVWRKISTKHAFGKSFKGIEIQRVGLEN